MDDHVEVLIIGAGPTGLGAAWRLSQRAHESWVLCEATGDAGGLAGSVVDEHGFTWDLGGHVQFSHYDHFDALMDDLLGRDGWLEHDRESWVWMRQRFIPYPFQLNVHRLPVAERWECLRGLLQVTQASPATTKPAHFGEWIDRSFGPGVASVFMRPYNFKVWAYPPEELDAGWVGDRVATVDFERILRNTVHETDDVSWGPNNRFRFPLRGGTGSVWRALARRLEHEHPGRLRYRQRLVRLDTARRIAHFEGGRTVGYRALVSSIPLDLLVNQSDLAPALAPALADLRYSSTHILGVGLHGAPSEALRTKCWMYFPEADCPFYRVTVFSNYSPNNVPDIARGWSLMAEVSESPAKPVDAARIVDETLAGLLATGLVKRREDVHHVWYRRLERGYPTPSLHRDRALATLLPGLERVGVRSRGRFGAWKYEVSNQDHSLAQGVEAVDALLDGSEEPTLTRPEVVNARRPSRR